MGIDDGKTHSWFCCTQRNLKNSQFLYLFLIFHWNTVVKGAGCSLHDILSYSAHVVKGLSGEKCDTRRPQHRNFESLEGGNFSLYTFKSGVRRLQWGWELSNPERIPLYYFARGHAGCNASPPQSSHVLFALSSW